MPLWQFLGLLAVHWVADFILQTHWQASNKSKRLDALARHVGTYTLALFVLSNAVLWNVPTLWVVAFALVNGALHFGTDYLTSRWTSRLFAPAMGDTHRAMNYFESYGVAPDETQCRIMGIKPAQHWHDFFVAIGFDQLIHQATLMATMIVTLELASR